MTISTHQLGFHYFPDTQHYRQSDLQRWLPELEALGVNWLVLLAPLNRSIPESFLNGLIEGGITPILHFLLPLASPISCDDLHLLFENYARWGVRYAILFDRPNARASWPPAAWSHHQLVENFLDQFIPLAEKALTSGLTPIFPPLEPGGDYWDTTFLRFALRNLQRRASRQLFNNLHIGAYSWPSNRPLDWGKGGPQAWTQSRPYLTLPDTQDQCGFRIFEWYAQLVNAELGSSRPIILLGTGVRDEDSDSRFPPVDPALYTKRNLEIARLLTNGEISADMVLAGNFWLLAAEADSNQATQAWYQSDGSPLPIATAWKNERTLQCKQPTELVAERKSITHYLLLPSYEWGISDWHLEIIRPFVKKYRPTIGFSLAEASLAQRITLIGNDHDFCEDDIRQLRARGSQVDWIRGDGTEIASFLAAA